MAKSSLIVNNPTLEPQLGFILTRQIRELNGVLHIEYWLTSPKGPVQLLTPPQQDVFFVSQSDLPQVEQILAAKACAFTSKNIELKTFEQSPVAAVYFESVKVAYKAKQALHDGHLTVFEGDIRLVDRYLMERFVYGSAEFTGQKQSSDVDEGLNYQKLSSALLKAGHYSPEFNVLSIDIECSEKGELYSIGLAAKDFKRVLMIGASEPAAPKWLQWVSCEQELLEQFVGAVCDYDPDVLIGWNVINFDFNLLVKRAALNKVTLNIGRGGEPVVWRNARQEVNRGYLSMPGRVVIDGIDALRTATYHFDSFSLEFVSRKLLGKGKMTEDVDHRMAEINHDFLHNKVKLAEYNLQDCVLVLEIFEHTKILEFLTLRSQLTGLELDKVGGSVAAFVNLYLPKLHRAGYVSPNRPEDGGLASPGGYVMESRPGLYRNVLVLDFKSLYPSIIRTFKVDPLGLIEGLLEVKADDSQSTIPGYKGAVFSRDKHFLPAIITSLWKQRDEAKKRKDHARSQAIKILMNSFYGVLGSGGCPFYDTRLASSITMRGHDIMQTTAQWIEEEGYQVIYGDTDSTFVWLEGDYNNQQARAVGTKLKNLINDRWSKKIQLDCAVVSELEIEFETHFTQFLMPTIRGSQQGSKKRYAGLKQDEHGSELVFKGLETVRSDWTELAKIFQTKLYEMVFAGESVEAFVKQTIADVLAGKHDPQLVYRKRIRRPLKLYVKNVPPHVRAARQADDENLKQGKPLRYQNKGWVSYVITLNGPQTLEHRHSPLDYEHYIKKQIETIADGILPFIDSSYEQITASQLKLFT